MLAIYTDIPNYCSKCGREYKIVCNSKGELNPQYKEYLLRKGKQ